jgi:hypothetical protein
VLQLGSWNAGFWFSADHGKLKGKNGLGEMQTSVSKDRCFGRTAVELTSVPDFHRSMPENDEVRLITQPNDGRGREEPEVQQVGIGGKVCMAGSMSC